MPTEISSKQHILDDGMEELGAKLRSLREAQDRTYEDVTQATHVRPFVLRAIEEGRVLEVADPVYARGFVKNYCEYLCADDLWNKYKDLFGTPETGVPVRSKGVSAAVPGINHPTPIFRRASTLWIYLILILAVAGALYLLWWQQKEGSGFTGLLLQNNSALRSASEDAAAPPGGAISEEIPLSPDLSVSIYPVSPEQAVSASQAVSAEPAESPANIVAPSADLSWMDGNASPASASRPPDPAAAARVDTGDRLFVEIIGESSRLEVIRSGRVLTRRTLRRGGTRTYRVTSDTEASFSSGAAVKVVWKGTTYEGIGDEEAPVRFRFSPSGAMTLLSGKSRYGQ